MTDTPVVAADCPRRGAPLRCDRCPLHAPEVLLHTIPVTRERPDVIDSEWPLGKPVVPRRAVLISVAALVVPVLAGVLGLPDTGAPLLVWLLALVPAFLLAYYRGWRGVATALALGMVALTAGNAELVLADQEPDHPLVVAGVFLAFLVVSLGVGFLSDQLHKARARAEYLALTDDLTGLPNRRHVRMVLEREFAAARRGRPLSVVMLDLDHFKAYNDRYGHRSGDEALRAFGEALAHSTRRMDVSGRYGGEEFLAVLSSAGMDGAHAFAARVRAAFAAHPANAHGLTFSAGLATFMSTLESPVDLVIAADQALYAAKRAGRNRAVEGAEATVGR